MDKVIDLGTKREVFDRVREHLLSQMKQSIDEEGDCKYRGPDGLKCAIGCLIPDDVYTQELEGWLGFLVSDVGFVIDGQPVHRYQHEAYGMLVDLQSLHDDMHPSKWKDFLDFLEKQHFRQDRQGDY
jgi:hypothetical protein